jgi:hypothetical protein
MPRTDLGASPAQQPTNPEPVRYARVSAAARRIMKTQGESGRFEFKSDSKAVSASVLVAAANWVALEPSRDHVTILVGVEEVRDEETGLTTGRPVRMSGNDLSTHVRRIQDFAAATRPVPVDLRIIEEGAETKTPFLRAEVRPTFPPHFDGTGRRVTRNGASTRPIEDEELLAIYLDREACQFEARFQATAQQTIDAIDAIHAGLGGMSTTLERLPGLIDGAEAAAYAAGYEAEDTQRDIKDVLVRLDKLERKLAERLNRTPDFVFLRLRYARSRAWRCFNVDRLLKPSKAAEGLAPRLLAHLNAPIEFSAYMVNLAHLQHWETALQERNRPGSMRLWSDQLKGATQIPPAVGQRVLTEDLDKLREKWSTAKKWKDLEGEAWAEDEWF